MKKQIRKPENWQDFEELCKLLWGEIWNCPEIKKNGRMGQAQHGVDIYGIPAGEKQYYGIQCKGKDEYTNAVLTEDEIKLEVEKAKIFKPLLKKLYFATTANKDAKIEEYVRLVNVDNIEKGLFEVHLFCWEDIAYLIDQNKKTHDWYVRKIEFASNFKIEISFEGAEGIKYFRPVLVKNHISYKSGEISLVDFYFEDSDSIREDVIKKRTDPQPRIYYINGVRSSKSSCVFVIKVKNIGNTQIENFKLYLDFNNDCYVSEVVSKRKDFFDNFNYSYNLKRSYVKSNFEFKPANNVLVQNDEVVSDKICIRPTIESPFCLSIPWKFVAKDFTEHGELKIVLDTQIIEKRSVEEYQSYFPDEVIVENYLDD